MLATMLLAMTVLPLVVAALPLLPCTLLLCAPATRRWGLRLAPWTPLPALAFALAPTPWHTLDLPWLLLGTRLGLDETGRVFLLLTALIWLLAGLFLGPWWGERPGRLRYTAFFLLTQAGNLGLCVSQDGASFYLFFTLMSFGAYGLVAHDPRPEARRAGRVYLALALLGEMLVLAGLLLMAHAAGSHLLPELRVNAAEHPLLPTAALLLFLGFGAKTGLPLLHVALPVSYAAAPAPGAAALAGAMIKAGVLGWLRFLPLGDTPLPALGEAAVLTGLLMAFAGVAAGLCQRQPGALLAYSSISQMGYFTLAVGAGLIAPPLWPALLGAVTLYTLHHGLAKAALFLGVGALQRQVDHRWALAGLALPALALSGAPLTSGAIAKLELKEALAALPATWAPILPGLLSAAAVGTALLMARLLWQAHRQEVHTKKPPTPDALPAAAWLAWGALLLAALGTVPAWAPVPTLRHAADGGALWDGFWPLAAAAALTLAALRRRLRPPHLPPGDLLVPAEKLHEMIRQRLRRPPLPSARAPRLPWRRTLWHRLEGGLRIWPSVGLGWLLLLGWMFLELL